MTGAVTLAAAKKEVERYYVGLSDKWVTVKTSPKIAKRWLADHYPEEVCSFCGRLWYEVDAMFSTRRAVICSSCVDEFTTELKRKTVGQRTTKS